MQQAVEIITISSESEKERSLFPKQLAATTKSQIYTWLLQQSQSYLFVQAYQVGYRVSEYGEFPLHSYTRHPTKPKSFRSTEII